MGLELTDIISVHTQLLSTTAYECMYTLHVVDMALILLSANSWAQRQIDNFDLHCQLPIFEMWVYAISVDIYTFDVLLNVNSALLYLH